MNLPRLKGNREQRQCGTKVRHANEDIAKAAARSIRRKKGDIVHPYFCEFCHYWHLGRHRSDRVKGGNPNE